MIVIVISLLVSHFHLYVCKIENFMVYARIIPHFPRFAKFTIKINLPISDVAPKFS